MKIESFPRSDDALDYETAWRARSFNALLDYSERLDALMPVDPERLRAVLATDEIRDPALRGAMHSLHLNFDRVLIVVGAFISGGAYTLPPSEYLRGEVAALTELGLVQVARSGQSLDDWSGLTRRGQQLAVYLIYRILVAATEDGET